MKSVKRNPVSSRGETKVERDTPAKARSRSKVRLYETKEREEVEGKEEEEEREEELLDFMRIDDEEGKENEEEVFPPIPTSDDVPSEYVLDCKNQNIRKMEQVNKVTINVCCHRPHI